MNEHCFLTHATKKFKDADRSVLVYEFRAGPVRIEAKRSESAD